MKRMLFGMVKFFIGKGLEFLRKNSAYYWESLQSLPENVEYAVIGLAPYNPMSSNRPMWLARADQVRGPRLLHNSRYVETRTVMLRAGEFTGSISLGDTVHRSGDKIMSPGTVRKIGALLFDPALLSHYNRVVK